MFRVIFICLMYLLASSIDAFSSSDFGRDARLLNAQNCSDGICSVKQVMGPSGSIGSKSTDEKYMAKFMVMNNSGDIILFSNTGYYDPSSNSWYFRDDESWEMKKFDIHEVQVFTPAGEIQIDTVRKNILYQDLTVKNGQFVHPNPFIIERNVRDSIIIDDVSINVIEKHFGIQAANVDVR